MDSSPQVTRLLDSITLGSLTLLEKRLDAVRFSLSAGHPSSDSALARWEKRYAQCLPGDLKDFYLTADGFSVLCNAKPTSSTSAQGGACAAPIAHLTIHPLEQLQLVNRPTEIQDEPSLADLNDLDDKYPNEGEKLKPMFDNDHHIFALASHGCGIVCLVYFPFKQDGSCQSEVWFLDRSFHWFFLAATFSAYFRMMCVHLGINEWQCLFTEYNASPQQQDYYNLLAPDCLPSKAPASCSTNTHVNVLSLENMLKDNKGKKKPRDQLRPKGNTISKPNKCQPRISR